MPYIAVQNHFSFSTSCTLKYFHIRWEKLAAVEMMKVYRPLCSDVTLRLAVDISPCYDDTDEDASADGDDENCHDVSKAGPRLLRDSTQTTSNLETTESVIAGNQNMKHQNSRSHNHSCSWYSRHNTPDKTAKDIYNHEHFSDTSLDNIQTISLDSEFKRCVEEEGNDFKEDMRDCELMDNRWKSGQQSFPVLDSDNENYQRPFNQYLDGELSCCFDGDPAPHYETCQSHILLGDDNGSCEMADEPTGVSKSSRIIQWRFKNISIDRNDNFCHDGTQMIETDQEDEDTEHMVHAYVDEVSCGSQEELPVDLDEDVDISDKMVMRQSMSVSYYGETEESHEEKNMAQSMLVDEIPSDMSKSIAEEIHDVLLGDDDDKTDSQLTSTGANELPFSYPFTLKHVGHLFDKSRHHFITPEKKRSNLPSASYTLQSDVTCEISSGTKTRTHFDATKTEKMTLPKDGTRATKCSVSTMTAMTSHEREVTHRGLHRFIPRHKDEINIGIGDPIHVIKECDDLWCEGINLRTGERGIFPAMYANDLNFLEESDDEDEYWKFSMRFLGSVEVVSHKGDETLVQAINKVARSLRGNINAASFSTLEINQYGIRMIDKSKEGHEKDAFSHFFALKNISFCGTHPKDNRYFAFITKHPRDYKFACHVFHGDRPTHRARDALGEAFKRFYQEYMAFTHPTEDIYME